MAQPEPASLDLRLGATAYRVRASFLAGKGNTVAERLKLFEMHEMDLSNGAVLEKGCVYVVPLQEALALPKGLSGAASAKSSIGRQICPRSFSVVARMGQMLNQIIFRSGKTTAPSHIPA